MTMHHSSFIFLAIFFFFVLLLLLLLLLFAQEINQTMQELFKDAPELFNGFSQFMPQDKVSPTFLLCFLFDWSNLQCPPPCVGLVGFSFVVYGTDFV